MGGASGIIATVLSGKGGSCPLKPTNIIIITIDIYTAYDWIMRNGPELNCGSAAVRGDVLRNGRARS